MPDKKLLLKNRRRNAVIIIHHVSLEETENLKTSYWLLSK